MATPDIVYVVETDEIGRITWVPPDDLQELIKSLPPEQMMKLRIIMENLLGKTLAIVMTAVVTFPHPQSFQKAMHLTARSLGNLVLRLQKLLNRSR